MKVLHFVETILCNRVLNESLKPANHNWQHKLPLQRDKQQQLFRRCCNFSFSLFFDLQARGWNCSCSCWNWDGIFRRDYYIPCRVVSQFFLITLLFLFIYLVVQLNKQQSKQNYNNTRNQRNKNKNINKLAKVNV